MCTKNEVVEAVHEVLFEQTEDGETYIGREIKRTLDKKADAIVGKLTMRFLLPFIVAVFSFGGAWYSLQHDVSSIQSKMAEGGRYTQEEHDVFAEEINRRFDEQQKLIDQRLLNIEKQLDRLLVRSNF